MEQYRFIIFGKVQGVYYRKFVSQNAMKRSVRGYVKNLPDGTVEVVAELIDDDLEEFLDILKDGSPLSKVEDIRHGIDDEADLIYDGFEIRY
jgi:acylphosphatase